MLYYGDVIHLWEDGYRNDGVTIYNGTKAYLNYIIDDYGSVPTEFRVGGMIPLDYWDIAHNYIINIDIDFDELKQNGKYRVKIQTCQWTHERETVINYFSHFHNGGKKYYYYLENRNDSVDCLTKGDFERDLPSRTLEHVCRDRVSTIFPDDVKEWIGPECENISNQNLVIDWQTER